MVGGSEERWSFSGWFVVDVAEDGAYVLSRVAVWLTGFSTCVDKVGDLLVDAALKLGLRAPTGSEVLAVADVESTRRGSDGLKSLRCGEGDVEARR